MESELQSTKLSFAFRLVEGAATLVLTNQRFFDWLWVEKLELEIPNLSLPISLTSGPELFQRRRTSVRSAQLRVDQNDINRLITKQQPLLERLGVFRLQVQSRDGFLELVGHVQQEHHSADIAARVLLTSETNKLLLIATTPLVYGDLPVPAPILLHQILQTIASGPSIDPPFQLQDKGLCNLTLLPVDMLVHSALPQAGWRIPDTSQGHLVDAKSTRGALRLRFDAINKKAHPQQRYVQQLLQCFARHRDTDELLRIGKTLEALTGYQQGLTTHPSDAAFLIGRILNIAATLPSNAQPRTEALESARVALQHQSDPQLAEYLNILNAGNTSCPIPPQRAPVGEQPQIPRESPTVQAGNAAILEAVECFHNDPSNETAFILLKTRATDIQDWSTLIPLFTARAQAIDDPDQSAELYYHLGQVFQTKIRDPERAAYAYEQALSFVPQHSQSLEALATTAYETNDWQRAYDLLTQLDLRSCKLAADTLYCRLGEIIETLGRKREAMDSFEAALQTNPTNRSALAGLARTALSVGEVHKAMEAAHSLLALIPPEDVAAITQLRAQLAEIYTCTGELDEAIRCYRMVLAESPTSEHALRSLIGIYTNRQRYADAAATLKQLIALTRHSFIRADLLYELGELYRTHMNDHNLAADAFLKAIDLAPNHIATVRQTRRLLLSLQ